MNDSKITDIENPENPEWTDEMFTKAKRGSFAVRGRPKSENPKKLTSLRLDADVIEFFKKSGKGWQTRLNAALKEYVISHQ